MVVHALAAHIHLARFDAVDAEHGARQLRAPRADQTRDAEHLARTDGEADVAQQTAVEVLDLQDRIAGGGGDLGVFLTHFTADHHGDEPLAVHLADGERIDMLAVTQDGNIVAEVEHLVQTVRNIDDGDALFAKLLDDAEHDLQLAVGQHGGRFVHDEHAGVVVDGVHDLHDLLFRHRQRRDLRVHVDVHAEIVHDLLRLPAHTGPVHELALHHNVAEEHIFCDRQRLRQLDLLMHHADARAARLDRRLEAAALAVENDLACVRLVDTGEHLDERGLARAVFTHKAVDRAALDVDGDVIQRLDAGEFLGDVFQC